MSDLCDYPTAKGRALGTISADGMSAMLGNDEKAQVFSDVEITSNCTALILGIAGTISSARG
ncbi:mitotic exit network interactor 1, partial [Coccidioides immitis]